MNRKPQEDRQATASTLRHEHEAEAAVMGAIAGAAMGAIGGPPGAAAGAVIGGVVAAAVAGVADMNSADRAKVDRELDAEIGVTDGEIGAPNLEHPPSKAELYASSHPPSAPPEEGRADPQVAPGK